MICIIEQRPTRTSVSVSMPVSVLKWKRSHPIDFASFTPYGQGIPGVLGMEITVRRKVHVVSEASLGRWIISQIREVNARYCMTLRGTLVLGREKECIWDGLRG
jgi:hypothetical protein